ncbi:hypothetical protein HKX48_009180, partial [Thoreauomyces humboldtii]
SFHPTNPATDTSDTSLLEEPISRARKDLPDMPELLATPPDTPPQTSTSVREYLSEIDALKSALQERDATISKLNGEVAEAKTSHANAEDYISGLEAQVEQHAEIAASVTRLEAKVRPTLSQTTALQPEDETSASIASLWSELLEKEIQTSELAMSQRDHQDTAHNIQTQLAALDHQLPTNASHRFSFPLSRFPRHDASHAIVDALNTTIAELNQNLTIKSEESQSAQDLLDRLHAELGEYEAEVRSLSEGLKSEEASRTEFEKSSRAAHAALLAQITERESAFDAEQLRLTSLLEKANAKAHAHEASLQDAVRERDVHQNAHSSLIEDVSTKEALAQSEQARLLALLDETTIRVHAHETSLQDVIKERDMHQSAHSALVEDMSRKEAAAQAEHARLSALLDEATAQALAHETTVHDASKDRDALQSAHSTFVEESSAREAESQSELARLSASLKETNAKAQGLENLLQHAVQEREEILAREVASQAEKERLSLLLEETAAKARALETSLQDATRDRDHHQEAHRALLNDAPAQEAEYARLSALVEAANAQAQAHEISLKDAITERDHHVQAHSALLEEAAALAASHEASLAERDQRHSAVADQLSLVLSQLDTTTATHEETLRELSESHRSEKSVLESSHAALLNQAHERGNLAEAESQRLATESEGLLNKVATHEQELHTLRSELAAHQAGAEDDTQALADRESIWKKQEEDLRAEQTRLAGRVEELEGNLNVHETSLRDLHDEVEFHKATATGLEDRHEKLAAREAALLAELEALRLELQHSQTQTSDLQSRERIAHDERAAALQELEVLQGKLATLADSDGDGVDVPAALERKLVEASVLHTKLADLSAAHEQAKATSTQQLIDHTAAMETAAARIAELTHRTEVLETELSSLREKATIADAAVEQNHAEHDQLSSMVSALQTALEAERIARAAIEQEARQRLEATVTEHQEVRDSLAKEKEALAADLLLARDAHQNTEGRARDLQQRVASHEEAASAHSTREIDLRRDLDTATANLAAIQAMCATLEATVQEQQATLSTSIRSSETEKARLQQLVDDAEEAKLDLRHQLQEARTQMQGIIVHDDAHCPNANLTGELVAARDLHAVTVADLETKLAVKQAEETHAARTFDASKHESQLARMQETELAVTSLRAELEAARNASTAVAQERALHAENVENLSAQLAEAHRNLEVASALEREWVTSSAAGEAERVAALARIAALEEQLEQLEQHRTNETEIAQVMQASLAAAEQRATAKHDEAASALREFEALRTHVDTLEAVGYAHQSHIEERDIASIEANDRIQHLETQHSEAVAKLAAAQDEARIAAAQAENLQHLSAQLQGAEERLANLEAKCVASAAELELANAARTAAEARIVELAEESQRHEAAHSASATSAKDLEAEVIVLRDQVKAFEGRPVPEMRTVETSTEDDDLVSMYRSQIAEVVSDRNIVKSEIDELKVKMKTMGSRDEMNTLRALVPEKEALQQEVRELAQKNAAEVERSTRLASAEQDLATARARIALLEQIEAELRTALRNVPSPKSSRSQLAPAIAAFSAAQTTLGRPSIDSLDGNGRPYSFAESVQQQSGDHLTTRDILPGNSPARSPSSIIQGARAIADRDLSYDDNAESSSLAERERQELLRMIEILSLHISTADQQLVTSQTTIAELQQELRALQTNRAGLNDAMAARVKTLEERVDRQLDEIANMEYELVKSRSQSNVAQDRIAELENALNQHGGGRSSNDVGVSATATPRSSNQRGRTRTAAPGMRFTPLELKEIMPSLLFEEYSSKRPSEKGSRTNLPLDPNASTASLAAPSIRKRRESVTPSEVEIDRWRQQSAVAGPPPRNGGEYSAEDAHAVATPQNQSTQSQSQNQPQNQSGFLPPQQQQQVIGDLGTALSTSRRRVQDLEGRLQALEVENKESSQHVRVLVERIRILENPISNAIASDRRSPQPWPTAAAAEPPIRMWGTPPPPVEQRPDDDEQRGRGVFARAVARARSKSRDPNGRRPHHPDGSSQSLPAGDSVNPAPPGTRNASAASLAMAPPTSFRRASQQDAQDGPSVPGGTGSINEGMRKKKSHWWSRH